MASIIKIKISGKGADTDAPTVEDLLDQIRDYFDLLRGIEEAVAEDGASAIEWRVVAASKNSPLDISFEPFPRHYATNIDRRVALVTRAAAEGLSMLQHTAEKPPYFSDPMLAKAQKIFERVTNGIDRNEVDFGEGLPHIELTPFIARAAAENTKLVLKPPADKPYNEMGSVEGTFHSVGRDGYGRRLLLIKHRLTGDEIKCIVSGQALSKVEQHQISVVWHSRRLLVMGTVHYKGLGRISQVEATDVRFLRTRNELPDVDDIVDESFTGGLHSEDYLESLRDGRLS